MSITTTSASRFSATPRATVAPTFPAPPTTVTLRFISAPSHAGVATRLARRSSHMFDDVVAELRRLQLRRAVHQSREVVRDALGADRAFHALDDQVRHFAPTE